MRFLSSACVAACAASARVWEWGEFIGRGRYGRGVVAIRSKDVSFRRFPFRL